MNKFNINELEKNFEKGLEKRLTINGETKTYQSFKFPINKLYYNDLNGRIASYIEEYNDTNTENISDLYLQNVEKYNKIISEYIIDSALDDGKSFNETKEDIKNKGQEIPGVILTDGRIIDGNRRFTALKKLYDETGNDKFSYFEAVCLDAPENGDADGWRKIKSLELNLQFNVNEKKGYNRIDELVSFYRDCIDSKTKMFDEKTYCFASGISKSKYNKDKNIVEVMLDYLDWRGKPKAFYILKNEKLDGPIEELALAINKMSADEWNSKKEVLYIYMTVNDDGDRTRDIRTLIKSAKTEGKLYNEVKDKFERDDIYSKSYDYIEKIDQKYENPNDEIEKQKIKNDLISELKGSYNNGLYLEAENNVNAKPIEIVEKAIKLIDSIDYASLNWLSPESKHKLKTKFDDLKFLIEKFDGVDDE